jgi:hypothetical protein
MTGEKYCRSDSESIMYKCVNMFDTNTKETIPCDKQPIKGT